MEAVKIIKTKEQFKISSLKRGEVHRFQLHLSDNALGVPWRVPVIVIRGEKKGPCLGITAAVHGNELNGISTIFKVLDAVSPHELSGTIVMVPICNVPGYLQNQRYFSDNVDLNRIMPGKLTGGPSDIYAHYFCQKLIKQFDYLLDLHTASHGRVNSLYIRADIDNDTVKALAYLQNPQIIVKKYDEEGTLRAWANEQGIPSITIEIGNPNAFQHDLIDETLEGIINTLRHLKMVNGKVKDFMGDATVCDHSYWLHSSRGGVADVSVKLAQNVKKGEVVAVVYDVFGQIKEEIVANRDSIVIGKNVRPNCDAGTRLVHLGVDFLE